MKSQQNTEDYEIIRPSGETVRSSVGGANTVIQNAITAVSDALDVISRAQGYVQIDNVYREMQEFLQQLHEQRMMVQSKSGDCEKEREAGGRLQCRRCGLVAEIGGNATVACLASPTYARDMHIFEPAAEPSPTCRHNCVPSICPQCATGDDISPTASEPTCLYDAGSGLTGASKWHKEQFKPEVASGTAELSLLVVDFGDSCVVKVEKGLVNKAFRVSCEMVDYDFWHNDIQLLRHSFTAFRAAIDTKGDKLPVPRIERYELSTSDDYILICKPFARGSGTATGRRVISREELDALSELAGKPLPVYTPKVGRWTQIGDANVSWCPVAIWWYER